MLESSFSSFMAKPTEKPLKEIKYTRGKRRRREKRKRETGRGSLCDVYLVVW